MAEDEEVRIPFRVKDDASGTIERIHRGVEKLGDRVEETVSRLTEMGSALAGLGGAFGFERMVETGKESLDQIQKLSKLTGTAADEVAGLRDAFEQSGVQAESVGNIIVSLGRKTAQLQEGGKQMIALARTWGVDLSHGPERAMVSISAALQKGTITQEEALTLMRTTGEAAGGLIDMLKMGPKELQETIDKSKDLNKHLAGGDAMERFERFYQASERIHEAWRRISERVVLKLAPALSRLSEKLSGWIDHLNVDRFINTLTKGLELAVRHARELGKIMIANAVLQKTTGTGLVGSAMRLPSVAGSIFRFGASRGAGVAGFAGGIMKGVGGLAGGGIEAAMGPLAGVLSTVMSLIGGITGIGLVAAAIYLVVKHLDVLKSKLRSTGEAIWGAVQNLLHTIDAVFAADAPLGRFARWVGDKLIVAVEYLGKLIEGMITALTAGLDELNDELIRLHVSKGELSTDRHNREAAEAYIANQKATMKARNETGAVVEKLLPQVNALMGLATSGKKFNVTDQQRQIYQTFKKAADVFMAETGGAKGYFAQRFAAMEKAFGGPIASSGTAIPGKPLINQDFRGSRFEIEQKFAEGFDPDRIAVAFANDISSLGERKMVSTLGPQFIR